MLRLGSRAPLSLLALAASFLSLACANAELAGPGGDAGASGDSGGTPASGGSASGGTTTSTGGVSSGTGGAVSAGGSVSTGGAITKGGSTSTGGGTSTGGSTSKGGSTGGGTGTPGATLLMDDFEDRDVKDWYPADTNGTWAVKDQGGSAAYVVTSTAKTLAVGGSVTWTAQRVEAKVMFTEGTSPIVSLMARWAEAKSFIVIEFRPGTASDPEGDMKLRQTDAGSTTDLCRFKPASVLPNTWNTIGVSVSGGLGSVATLFFNGQAVTADKPCALTKAGPTAGGIALGVQSGGAAFDDVVVTVP